MPAVAVKQPYAFVLREDEYAENPRETGGHFGKMVCFHRRYNLGDKHEYKEPEDFLRGLVSKTIPAKDICDFTIAEKSRSVELKYNQFDGDWLVIARYHEEWEEVASFGNSIAGREAEIAGVILDYMDTAALLRLAEYGNIILPLYLYDHSGLSMSTMPYRGRAQHAEWDSMQVGWIYAGKKEAAAAFGAGIDYKAMEAMEAEVSEYDSYLRGDCYGYQLYKNGVEVDSCWGFIGRPEAIKPAVEDYLPDGCKGVMDNLVYLNTDREVDDFLLEQEKQSIYMEGDPIMSTIKNEQLAPGSIEARAYPYAEPRGNIIAGASLSIGTEFGNFAITNIDIINGKNGPFVSMPNRKDKEGNYKDITFPTTKEFRETLNGIVMDAYNAAVEKGIAERASEKSAQEPPRASATAKLENAKKEAAKAAKPPKAEKPAPAQDAR